MSSQETLLIIGVMALAAAVCRLGGFWFMGFVRITPRIDAGLKMLPVGVMIGLMVPAVVKGGWPEALGIGMVMVLTKVGANEFFATCAGLAAVGGLRVLLGVA